MEKAATDVRLCFVGDSLVNGTGDEQALGWAGRLVVAAQGAGHPVTYYNLGVRRETTKEIASRIVSECTLRLPSSCDGRIVLSCGVNDTTVEAGRPRLELDESLASLRAMLDAFADRPLLLIGPPPIDDDAQNQRIAALSRAFAAEADGRGVGFVSLFEALAADRSYLREVAGRDGAHPTSRGYAKIAELILGSGRWWF